MVEDQTDSITNNAPEVDAVFEKARQSLPPADRDTLALGDRFVAAFSDGIIRASGAKTMSVSDFNAKVREEAERTVPGYSAALERYNSALDKLLES